MLGSFVLCDGLKNPSIGIWRAGNDEDGRYVSAIDT
jgi:hypothetical protein